MLGNGLAVCAGRVAQNGFLRQHTLGHIGIGPGGEQLQHVQVLRGADLFRRDVAEDEICLADLLLRCFGARREDDLAVLSRLLCAAAHGLFIFFLDLERDEYFFHRGSSSPVDKLILSVPSDKNKRQISSFIPRPSRRGGGSPRPTAGNNPAADARRPGRHSRKDSRSRRRRARCSPQNKRPHSPLPASAAPR